jgi:acyl-CoA dehydrogenase
MTIIAAVLLIGVLWTLAYVRAPYLYWIIGFGTLIAGLDYFGQLHGVLGFFFWLVYALCVGVYLLPGLRKRWIARPLLRQFRKVMPAMSQTEQTALTAGSVWWDAELFTGRPEWNKLLAMPAPDVTKEERAFIDGPVQELCERLDDWAITHEHHDLPPEIWAFMKQSQLFGIIIPKRYGGLEFSAQAHSTIVMKLASRSITAAVTIMVPNSLGPAKLLLHYGTEAQKDHYLPRLARGEEMPCFALTGPQAGSDAGAIPDTGMVCRQEVDGEETLGIRLNWEKRYITLGPVSTVIGLAFKMYDPDHLLGDKEKLGVTVALVPSDTPGVDIGKRHIPLNIPFQNGPNSGKDVFVPLDSIIGGQACIGQGWRMLVECLAEGRGISLPALATGAGKAASRYTGAYARIRRQFKLPIGYFEGVEEALARIAALTYKMDAARTLTVGALDCGEKPSVISAIVKYHLTESYRQVINDAMDVQGGSGICLGPRNLVGRAYQAIPISITVEGANILTRSMIIFGQGAIRCHPYVLEEFQAAQERDPHKALEGFDRALFGHVGFIASNLARSFFLGLTRAALSPAPVNGPTRRYFRHLNWMSAGFAICADAAMMTLGGSLKRKERLSSRLGDVLSELYLTSAVLKRFEDQGRQEADLPLVRWASEDALYRIQESTRALLLNLPFRPLAWLLRLTIFPTGLPYSEPSDRLGHQAARILLEPSHARDRLTEDVFTSTNPESVAGRLDQALQTISEAAPIERTVREARRAGQIRADSSQGLIKAAVGLQLITEADQQLLERAEQLRNQVIQVDAFDQVGAGETPLAPELAKRRNHSTESISLV